MHKELKQCYFSVKEQQIKYLLFSIYDSFWMQS